MIVVVTNKAGRLARQVGRVRQAGGPRYAGMQARSIDVPTVTANIFAAATNRTNILNKTSSSWH